MKQLLFTCLFVAVVTASFAQKLSVTDLTCNYKTNPLGIGNIESGLSWKLSSAQQNTMQTAWQVRVAENEGDLSKGKNLTWDSGKVSSGQSLHIKLPDVKLKSGQRYFWQVKVWDNHGNTSSWSPVNFFETGLLSQDDWSAKWIEADRVTNGVVTPVPMFYKGFSTLSPVRSARLYITAHGVYQAQINGHQVGNELLRPGWTSYNKRLQYQVYDVTSLLKQGANSTCVSVADGWYRGGLEWRNQRNFFGKEAGLLYQLEITTADGKKQTIASDRTWKSSFEGPVRAADIYNGERYDSRLEKDITDAVTNNWNAVRVVNYGLDNIVPQESPAVTIHEQFNPVKFINTPKGETVIDFGQNLVGWVQLKIKGKSGDSIRINHAEVLDKDGNFYTGNLRTAKSEDVFILNGKDQVLEPKFTFHGFRYVKISDYPVKLDASNISAFAVYSNMKPTGSFTSSNALINQLQHNIQWGQKGNFVDIPTDCPQRDERLGWTGDAQVFFNTAAYNMNVASFFTKWMQDVKADQYPNGNVPVVVPATAKRGNDGSAGWSDIATIIPWNFYEAYGDKQFLERQYNSMKDWVEYLRSVSPNDLNNKGSHYGDWLFYTMADDRDGKAAITDKYLIAQVFYAASVQNLINAANVLGKTEDVSNYTALLKRVKDAFMREYVTPSGRLVSSSQTAYVLALNFDMLPENLRQQAAERLVDNIKSYKNHITTGFLGTPYICHVLSRFGQTETAYKLLLQDSYPSWLYPVKMGATTIWERWDGIKPDGDFEAESMNSFNHYAYGAIGDWMYRTVAGLTQQAKSNGYKEILIAPQPGGGFTSASAELETGYGKVASSWKLDGKNMNLTVLVPANASAKVVLPNSSAAKITVNGTEVTKLKDVKVSSSSGKDQELTLGSGNYSFAYSIP